MKPENIFSALSALRQEGRLRQVQDLRMETASLGVDREGKQYIVFNSNDYLGMTHAKEVQEAAAKAVRFGTGSGGARLTSGAAFELSDLEKEIADFKHTEDAVIFNTGYMANLGVLYALAGKGDVIFRIMRVLSTGAVSQKPKRQFTGTAIWRIWKDCCRPFPAKGSASL